MSGPRGDISGLVQPQMPQIPQISQTPQPTATGGNIADMAQTVRPAPTRDNPEDMFSPEDNWLRNQGWAMPGPYNTPLTPPEEQQFQAWVQQNNVNWKPDELGYDMRGYWKAMQGGDPRAVTSVNPYDQSTHYPDIWKTPYEATFSAESMYAAPNAPVWQKQGENWLYMTPEGHVIFDDAAGRWYGLPTF